MSQNLQNFAKFQKFQFDNLVDFEKVLQNAYFLAKIGADTAENEQHFAEILPKIGNYPSGRSTSPRGPQGRPTAPWSFTWDPRVVGWCVDRLHCEGSGKLYRARFRLY